MLRIGTAVWQPELYPCALEDFTTRPSCPKPGIWPEFYTRIAKVLNITLKLTNYNDLPDAWERLYNDLIDGTIDTTTAQWVVTPERLATTDLIFPITQSEPVFLSQIGGNNLLANASLPFTVFTTPLWFIVIAAMLILTAVTVLSAYVINRKNVSFWELISYAIGQSGRSASSGFAVNALLVMSGLCYVLFTSIYAGTMLRRLLLPVERKSFKDNNDLINKISNKELTLVVTSSADFYSEQIRTSNSNFFSKLRDALENNPKVVKPQQEMLEAVKTGPYVHATTGDAGKSYLTCNLTLSEGDKADTPLFWNAIILPKDSNWTDVLTKTLYQEWGFMGSLIDKYNVDVIDECEKKLAAEHKPLTMVEIGGAFAFLFGFAALAFVLLGFERAVNAASKAKEERKKSFVNKRVGPDIATRRVFPKRNGHVVHKKTFVIDMEDD